MGPHCLPVCKNRFEKFARIFSRRHKQTTFSDAGFLGFLRVKMQFTPTENNILLLLLFLYFSEKTIINFIWFVCLSHMKCQPLLSQITRGP